MEIPKALQDLIQENDLYKLAESLCQNKNNGKRLITDVAISKIPYVMYPDLTKTQSLIVHELAEHLLNLAKSQNNSNEIAVTYNLDNNDDISNGMMEVLEKTGICFGTNNETELFSDSKTMSIINRAKSIAIVNLHNHPSCNTFSIQDISVFLKETAIKLMLVLGNNGELYYLSKNIDKYNFLQAREYLVNATKAVAPTIGNKKQTFLTYKEMRDIGDLFLKNCDQFGIEYKHVLGNERELQQVKSMTYEDNQQEEEIDYDQDR